MARVFIDGFESGDMGAWDLFGPSSSVSGSYAYTGNYGVSMDASTAYFGWRYLPDSDTIYFAMKVYAYYAANYNIVTFAEDDIRHTRIQTYYTAAPMAYLRAYRHTTLLATSAVTFNSGNWILLEGYLYLDDSAGRIVLKVNGLPFIDFTGDTQEAGTGLYNQIRIGYDGATATRMRYDDIVLDDAAWIGDTRIYGISPNGAGNSSAWTPSAGNNYECVDEVPPSDSDYVETNTSDNVDTYAMADMPSVYEVKSVQVQTRAQKTGAPIPSNLALVVRPPTGGTDYVGSDQAAETSWRGHTELWENNPYTSSPWTESEVNGMEAGIKSRA